MKIVTLQVATLQEVKRRAQSAFRGKKQDSRISFATPERLFRLLTAGESERRDRRQQVRGGDRPPQSAR
jgi:hypothetical protein